MSRILVVLLTVFLCLLPAYAQAPGGEGGPPPLGQGPPMGPPGGPPPDEGPHGGPPPRDGHPGHSNRAVPPHVEAKFLAFVKQVDPASMEELARLKALNPEQYQRVVAEGAQRMHFLNELQKRDPSAYQDVVKEIRLEGAVRRLVETYRNAPSDKKPDLKDQVRQTLSQLFDARETNRRHEMERLEKDLSRMKTSMHERAKNKTTIVNRRLEEMLSEPGTSW